jgi:hypothetical protein
MLPLPSSHVSVGSVATHGKLPDLKSLGVNSLVIGLNDRDFVEQGSALPHYPFFAALIFAQRARCAAAILFLPASDILRVGRAVLFCADLFPVVAVPSNNRTT